MNYGNVCFPNITFSFTPLHNFFSSPNKRFLLREYEKVSFDRKKEKKDKDGFKNVYWQYDCIHHKFYSNVLSF